MPRASRIKPLSDTEIKNAKPKEKTYRLYDGKGLCLRIMKTGSKHWEFRFKNPETLKDDTIIIGEYPYISLSQAREMHQDLRVQIENGINPKQRSSETTFKHVFEIWWLRWSETKTKRYSVQVKNAIEKNCMPILGKLEMTEIKPSHIASALQPFEDRGVLEYLHRTRSALNQMFSFALARGICELNPVMMVTRDAFKRPKSENHM
ncbi:integrase arm-type DNA-binding domain-containing protein [Ignatzschineria larvae DSM 13226]|uniref:Integrase arm-type DNA-binding domain-containing protein n=1 Tax=Ignatzschineria larvae DSM 13226 TaxID=1111732 RepID=A0ABZ3BWW7_9GAMM|nr:integrase arm-type DNA-binding domain-containing protein [Ignatzschineria larvae]